MVREYLSITSCIQPTNCGCVPFHPTIDSKAFILSTLATPMPSHDIPREFMPSLREISLCHNESARFIRCFPSIKLTLDPLGCALCTSFWLLHPLFKLAFSSGVSPLVVCLYVSYLPSFGRFSICPIPSIRRKLGYVGLCGTSS